MSEPQQILIADDDQNALLIMEATLEAAGFVVTTAANGAEALEAFDAAQFDMIMLDVEMPVMGGHEACAALRARAGLLLPIVMVTGMDDVASIDSAYRAGATDFITKPISWALMGHRVRYLLRSYQIALDLRAAEAGIRRMAHFDSLTGLPNREYFKTRLSQAIELATRDSRQLAVLYIDLDNFKRINDTLGHSVGDALLVSITQRLRAVLRATDSSGHSNAVHAEEDNFSRLGGDEFVLLLPNISGPVQVEEMAERLLRTISEPVQLVGHEVEVTTSIGIAMFPADGTDQLTLIHNADLAMYHAKRQNHGSHAAFDASMGEGALKRVTMERELRGAIERNEFAVEYQPQFELGGTHIIGFEALLRWHNVHLGTVPPSEFIPVAEASGLIVSIGEWVLSTACHQGNAWHKEFETTPVRVSVNVSGLQLSQRLFSERVAAVLRATEFPAKLLELEITESVIMQNEDRAIEVLRRLKAVGVTIAIDDFGTGHSSFSRLRDFPIDRLKIDRAFIQHSHTDILDRAIVSGIISMAKALNLEVVAEGVEEHAQLLLLQDEHCNLAQGYLLGRPMGAHAATALLRRATCADREPQAAPRLAFQVLELATGLGDRLEAI